MIHWAIIPVKPLRDSKSRLSHILSADQRAALTEALLAHTLDVLRRVPAIAQSLVVRRDQAILKIARRHQARTFNEGEKTDLNRAVSRGVHIAAAQQADAVLILPADLPFLTVEDVEMMLAGAIPAANGNSGNGYYYQERAITICPDQHNDGTNALLVTPPTGFTFHFGPNSFQRHLDEAARLQIARRIIHAPGIKFDLDTEKDWAIYRAMSPSAAVSPV
jgi:2-phospho-L-lactate guanylyltransferase